MSSLYVSLIRKGKCKLTWVRNGLIDDYCRVSIVIIKMKLSLIYLKKALVTMHAYLHLQTVDNCISKKLNKIGMQKEFASTTTFTVAIQTTSSAEALESRSKRCSLLNEFPCFQDSFPPDEEYM